jgi:hypothetical protein
VLDGAETGGGSGSLVYEITVVVGTCVGDYDAEWERWNCLSNPGPAQSGGRDPCELKVLFLAADYCENHLDIALYVETQPPLDLGLTHYQSGQRARNSPDLACNQNGLAGSPHADRAGASSFDSTELLQGVKPEWCSEQRRSRRNKPSE